MRKLTAVSLAALAIAMAGPATAGPTFTATNGSNLSASATFTDLGGGQLKVTLTNTSAVDVLNPSGVLTAVFFDLSNSLGKVSALLPGGSTVFYDPQGQPAGGIVGGEWAYLDGISPYTPGGAAKGISSSGFGIFGPGNLFPGPDLESPLSPDGVQYGILSAGDNTATGNTGITGSGGLIKNSVDFVLTYTGAYDQLTIGNVSFQYGTALTEPCIGVCGPPRQETPEPTSIALVGLALLGLARTRRRKA